MAPRDPFISVDFHGPDVVIRLGGEVDTAYRAAMDVVAGAMRADPRPDIVIDLSDATFIDCTVLTLLERAATAARSRGGSARVRGASPRIARTVRLGGLGDLLEQPPSPHLLDCPVCATPLEVQTWASKAWVDCPSNHRLGYTVDAWKRLTMQVRIVEIDDWVARHRRRAP